MNINNILSNEEIFKLATAEGSPSASIFTAYDNYDAFKDYVTGLDTKDAMDLRNAFIGVAMAWYDKEMLVEEAYDILEEQGFGTKESMAYAGMMRNLYVKVSNSVDPKYKNLQNGDSFSPDIVRKPTVTEIFFTTSSDFQNYITVQPVETKTAFLTPNGVSELTAKCMEGLRNSFVDWVYNKKLEVLNLLVNDENLKTSQIAEVPMDSYSNAELQNLSNAIDNIISAITLTSNGAFNMNSWKYRPRKEDLCVLMRPIIDNTAKNYITPYAFNDVVLKNGIKKVYVENFGGLVPTVEINGVETELKAIHDTEGRNTETYSVDGTTSGTVYEADDITWKDPNADVLAVIADKDIMKVIEQEGFIIEPWYNPRTRSTNFWASEANVGFIYDRQKDVVVVKKKSSPVIEPTYTYTSAALEDGEEYAYNYLIVSKEATVTVENGTFASTDEVEVDCGLATIQVEKTLTDEHTVTLNFGGVNMSGADVDIFVSVGEEELASFTILAQPAPTYSITIDQESKSVEIDKETSAQIELSGIPTTEDFTDASEYLFTISTGGQVQAPTISEVEAGINAGEYTLTLNDSAYSEEDNGTYSATLKLDKDGDEVASDTFTLIIAIPTEPPLENTSTRTTKAATKKATK